MKRVSMIVAYLLILTFAVTACYPSLWFVSNSGSDKSDTSQTTQSSETAASDSSSVFPESTVTEESSETGSGTDTQLSTTQTTSGTSSVTTTTKPTTSKKSTNSATTTTTKPDTGKEMRAVWVSYIELNSMLNGKTVAQAKAAIDGVMVNCKAYGLNAVIFHVRANSDAYYKSKVFSPAASVKNLLNAGFDPLAYAVEAAHSRGLELHAWVNPYRIGTNKSFAKCNDYFESDGRYYYNPASDDAQKLIISGVDEIVRNYKTDGVQFDDYFYPSNLKNLPNDDYNKYKSDGGKMSVGDWRRTNVSKLIATVYKKVHSIRSGCVFGVSPRGVQDQNYDVVYADVALWMKEKGYIDYICPQVYFGFLHKTQAFDKNVDSWIAMPRHSSVRLYIGLALHKIGILSDQYAGTNAGKAEWAQHNDIMKRSLLSVRSKPECGGVMFFSYRYFTPASLTQSSWSRDVAIREVENLLTVMKP